MPIDLLEEIESQIRVAEDTLIRLRNARAALANYRESIGASTVPVGPAVEGLPVTAAIRQVLQYHAERGKDVMTVGEVFESLRPYEITLAQGKTLWKSSNPWKAFVIACTAPDNVAKFWTVEKALGPGRKRLLKTDTIRLKHLAKKPAK